MSGNTRTFPDSLGRWPLTSLTQEQSFASLGALRDLRVNRHMSNDRQSIEALNHHDREAVLRGDVEAIVAQWDADFVVIPNAGPIVRGREANAAVARSGREQMQALEPLEYATDFAELIVAGDFAFEWGTYCGRSRVRATGDVIAFGGKLLRILRRQADGGWKMYRTMISADQ